MLFINALSYFIGCNKHSLSTWIADLILIFVFRIHNTRLRHVLDEQQQVHFCTSFWVIGDMARLVTESIKKNHGEHTKYIMCHEVSEINISVNK